MTDIGYESSFETVQKNLDGFLEATYAESAFREPHKQGKRIVIPAAEAVSVMGFSVVSGFDNTPKDIHRYKGIGVRTLTRPLATIVISPDGTHIRQVIDITKLGLAGLTAGAFILSMFKRMLNLKKALDEMGKEAWK